MADIKAPQLIEELLAASSFQRLKDHFYGKEKSYEYDPEKGRYFVSSDFEPLLVEYSNILTPIAQKIFGSKTLKPTYSFYAHYFGDKANLPHHIDDNACTYTLDLCLYQNEPWDIWVDGSPYTLHPNTALAFYSNDQEHWREKMPNPEINFVGLCFFHFAEPDHWYFTKGPDYINFIRLKERHERILTAIRKKEI